MSDIDETNGSLKAPIEAREVRLRLASVLLLVVLSVALLSGGAFEPLENRLTSLRAQLLDRAPTGQVAIVEIDAKSLAEMHTWPWSRRNHARVLERLHSSGASIIAFDVDFSSLSEPVGDRAFADALRRFQPTILPIFQQRASDHGPDETIIKSQPAAMFGSAWVGGVNIFAGTDGVVREYPAATTISGQIRPSMATLLAENDKFGDRAFHPDWSIDPQGIPRFSFVDVANGRVPRAAIAGKRILIGATAIELGDRYTIPRFGTVPGVVVQALAAESLLQNRALTRSGALPTMFGLILVAGLLGGLQFRRFARTFPLAAAAIVTFVGLAPLAIQARWPLSMDSVAILFCALGCIGARVLLEIRRRVRLGTLRDSETGLGNERALEAALDAVADSPGLLVAATIDRFEHIRDAIGAGTVSGLVRSSAARIEAIAGTPVYRIAPDTLAWVQSGTATPIDLDEVFREGVETTDGTVDVRLIVGLDREHRGTDARSRIGRAVAAIGRARAAGETCHWYEGTDHAVRRELSLMGELRRGMASGEVTVEYQPQLDLKSGNVTHAEALVRWRHPVEGLIAPGRFVPLAEATGVVRELTQFVLGQVVADSVRAKFESPLMRFAVNVSAADLATADFAEKVRDLVADVDPARLTLEVTESAIISSPQTAIAVLTALRDCGIQLSVDDYGTGQSTLSYLKRLPVNELKIDKSFVTAMCANESDRIMVRSTINLAHELKLKVVAEGVEDAATLRLLTSLGCDLAQGYFIGKAMPFEQLCRLADERCDLRDVA